MDLVFEEKHKWLSKCDYRLITTIAEWEEWKLNSPSHISLDTETNGLNPEKHNVVGVSLCKEEGKAIYVPLGHIDTNFENRDYFFKSLNDFLSDKIVLAYNAKFDVLFLKQTANVVIKNYEDVMISSHMDFPDAIRKGLKESTLRILNKSMIELRELFNPKSIYYSVKLDPDAPKPKATLIKDRDFGKLSPVGYSCYYACSDVDMTLAIYNKTKKERVEQKAIYEIECKLLPLVYKMENTRVFLDADYLARIIKTVFQKLLILEIKIFDTVGKKYNILSNPKTAEVLLEMGVPLDLTEKSAEALERGDKKKDGTPKSPMYKTGKDVLKEHSKAHPIIMDILTYRKYIRSLTGYLVKLYQGGLDSRGVKFRFNQIKTATGRFSASGRDQLEGEDNVSAKDQDSDFIAANAQNITGNSDAVWLRSVQIRERRLKDTGEVCYKYYPERLTDEEIETFENLKKRLIEPKVSKRRTKADVVEEPEIEEVEEDEI